LRRSTVALALLALVYLLTRLVNLTLLPLFVDEAIHLHWARRLAHEGWLLRILLDGKLLQVLAMAPSVSGASDPVWWGRVTSVAAGGLGLWVSFRLGARFSSAVGLVAAALYVLCPFTLFHDRMALADGFLAVFAGVALYESVILHGDPSRGRSVRLGLAMSAAVLSKVPGLVTLAFPPLSRLALGRAGASWGRRVAASYLIALALIVFPVWYFFAHTDQLAWKAKVSGPGRLVTIQYNAGLALEWLLSYWTAPVLLGGTAMMVYALLARRRLELLLAGAAALPVLAFVVVGYHLFPRYILLATIPFLVLAARALCAFDEHVLGRLSVPPGGRFVLRLLLAGVVAWPAVAHDRLLLVDPTTAPLHRVDRFQYIDGWPSGYAWAEAAEYVRGVAARSSGGVRLLVDRSDRRTAIRVLRAYLMNDSTIEIIPVDMRERPIQRLVAGWARERTALVLRSAPRPEKLPPLPNTDDYTLAWLRSFHKPDRLRVGEVYLVTPRKDRPAAPAPEGCDREDTPPPGR
jgi:hypothetical protein